MEVGMRFSPRSLNDDIWKLWDEGLKPTSIAGLLNCTLQEVYDTIDESDGSEEYEPYDEDTM